MIVHIADFNPDVEVSVVVAECGAVALIMGDASVSPEEFDFVSLEWARNATCERCVDAFCAKQANALRYRHV